MRSRVPFPAVFLFPRQPTRIDGKLPVSFEVCCAVAACFGSRVGARSPTVVVHDIPASHLDLGAAPAATLARSPVDLLEHADQRVLRDLAAELAPLRRLEEHVLERLRLLRLDERDASEALLALGSISDAIAAARCSCMASARSCAAWASSALWGMPPS